MFILLLCEVILDAKWFAWCQRAAGGRVSLGSILVPTPMRPPGTANCRAFFSAKSDMMPELGSFKSWEVLHYLGVWMDLGYFGLIVIYLVCLRPMMAGDGRWWQMSRWRQMMVDDGKWWQMIADDGGIPPLTNHLHASSSSMGVRFSWQDGSTAWHPAGSLEEWTSSPCHHKKMGGHIPTCRANYSVITYHSKWLQKCHVII